jgi:hypothetical protein
LFEKPAYSHLTVLRLHSPRSARAWVADLDRSPCSKGVER